MTDVVAPSVSAPRRLWASPGAWIRAKDPNLLAVKRSVRAAVFMPGVFGLAHVAFGSAGDQLHSFVAKRDRHAFARQTHSVLGRGPD